MPARASHNFPSIKFSCHVRKSGSDVWEGCDPIARDRITCGIFSSTVVTGHSDELLPGNCEVCAEEKVEQCHFDAVKR